MLSVDGMKMKVFVIPLELSTQVQTRNGVIYPFYMIGLFIFIEYACNGVMDVVIARKGTCIDDALIALRYVVGKEYSSDLMSYIKAKALEINSNTDEVIMLDGEVFPGPNPFRFVSIPSLLTVYGEY